MLSKKITGIVQPDGRILSNEAVDLPAGSEVRLEVMEESWIPRGVTLAEAKRLLAEADDRPMTPEEEAAYHRAFDELRKLAREDTGLPPDYADEIDHYLYGTPKRTADDKGS